MFNFYFQWFFLLLPFWIHIKNAELPQLRNIQAAIFQKNNNFQGKIKDLVIINFHVFHIQYSIHRDQAVLVEQKLGKLVVPTLNYCTSVSMCTIWMLDLWRNWLVKDPSEPNSFICCEQSVFTINLKVACRSSDYCAFT